MMYVTSTAFAQRTTLNDEKRLPPRYPHCARKEAYQIWVYARALNTV